MNKFLKVAKIMSNFKKNYWNTKKIPESSRKILQKQEKKLLKPAKIRLYKNSRKFKKKFLKLPQNSILATGLLRSVTKGEPEPRYTVSPGLVRGSFPRDGRLNIANVAENLLAPIYDCEKWSIVPRILVLIAACYRKF